MIDPHHRVHAAITAVESRTSVADQPVKELMRVIRGTSKNEHLKYAWDKYKNEFSRTILDSYLLANTTYDVIHHATKVPILVVKAYGQYIFDSTVFKDQLDKISYVGNARTYLPPEQQAYLEAALNRGPDFITWLLNGTTTKSPKAVLEATMMESLFMGQMHRGAAITSEIAKQSRAWTHMAAQTAANLQRLDPADDQDALAELKLALAFKHHVINADDKDAPNPDDILH